MLGAGRCGLGRGEVGDGSCYVLLSHLPALGFGIFRLVRSMQQVLWPAWSPSALGRDDFAQTRLEGHWLQLLPPWPLLISPFSSCRSNCAAQGAGRVLGKEGLNH